MSAKLDTVGDDTCIYVTRASDGYPIDEVNSAPENSELWHAKHAREAKLKEKEEVAKIEKNHGAELDAFCQSRGWGKYAHQGRDSKICIIRDWRRERKAA